MSDIVVVGSLNLDLVARVERFPLPGQTVVAHSISMAEGGKGANQAVAAARLGASVAMVGRVGNDPFGDRLRKNLGRNGVDTRFVRVDEAQPTGTAMITVDDSGENAIVVCPGANASVTPSDVDDAMELLRAARIVLLQFEVPFAVVDHALRRLSGSRTQVILNPAPAVAAARGLLGRATVLVLNESEATMLSGHSVFDVRTASEAARALLGGATQAVVVTLGAVGAVLADASGLTFEPALRVEAVDTTGAGDAFVGAMAAALLLGKTMVDAVRYASAAGGLAVTRSGAQPSLPTAEEVEAEWTRGE